MRLLAFLLLLCAPAAYAFDCGGSWQTGYGELILKQTDSRVTGTYFDGTARIVGDLVGRTLTFRYVEGADEGDGIFRFAILPASHPCAVSSYTAVVDWAASAGLEFLYLDCILSRNMTPAAAAATVAKELNFADEARASGSPFGALGFIFIPPPL
jgi:hypothetical protein